MGTTIQGDEPVNNAMALYETENNATTLPASAVHNNTTDSITITKSDEDNMQWYDPSGDFELTDVDKDSKGVTTLKYESDNGVVFYIEGHVDSNNHMTSTHRIHADNETTRTIEYLDSEHTQNGTQRYFEREVLVNGEWQKILQTTIKDGVTTRQYLDDERTLNGTRNYYETGEFQNGRGPWQMKTQTATITNADNTTDVLGQFDTPSQNGAGDCWLITGILGIKNRSWGQEALNNAVHYNMQTGEITVNFANGYGSYTFTNSQLEEASRKVGDNGKRVYSSNDRESLAVELAVEASSVNLDGGFSYTFLDLFFEKENPYTNRYKNLDFVNYENENYIANTLPNVGNMRTRYLYNALFLLEDDFASQEPECMNFISIFLEGYNYPHAVTIVGVSRLNDTVTYINPWHGDRTVTEKISDFIAKVNTINIYRPK